MKKQIFLGSIALSFLLLLSGCIAIGNHVPKGNSSGTLGQQLLDLKSAQTMGAISEAEYETLKAKLLGNKPVRDCNKR